MFDFFQETSEFFSSISEKINSFENFMKNSVDNFDNVLNWLYEVNSKLPSSLAWIFPIVIFFILFDYLRGRG